MAVRSKERGQPNEHLGQVLTLAKATAGHTDATKRLLMLLLLKLGSTSEEIAMALGIAPSAVRTSLPGRKVKKLLPIPIAATEG